MAASSSKKPTKQKTNLKSTLQNISHSRKKAALQKTKLRASSSQQSIASTSKTSRRASVEDVEDNEPTHIGGTLDADGDRIMESSDDEGDNEPNSNAEDRMDLSDEEDVRADDEEIELSMS